MVQQLTQAKRRLLRGSAAFLRRVKAAVREVLPDAELIFYGSRARGDAHADSDWDILVLTDQAVPFALEMSVWDRLYSLELESGEIVSAIVKNRQDWADAAASPLHENIERDGVAV